MAIEGVFVEIFLKDEGRDHRVSRKLCHRDMRKLHFRVPWPGGLLRTWGKHRMKEVRWGKIWMFPPFLTYLEGQLTSRAPKFQLNYCQIWGAAYLLCQCSATCTQSNLQSICGDQKGEGATTDQKPWDPVSVDENDDDKLTYSCHNLEDNGGACVSAPGCFLGNLWHLSLYLGEYSCSSWWPWCCPPYFLCPCCCASYWCMGQFLWE